MAMGNVMYSDENGTLWGVFEDLYILAGIILTIIIILNAEQKEKRKPPTTMDMLHI